MKDNVVSQRIQDAFVFLAITDTKFLQVARRSVKAEYFSSQVTEDIINICYSYFDQFNTAPENHFNDELVRALAGKENERKQLYIDYISKIQQMEPPNQAYIISRINQFICAREFEEAAIKFVEFTQKGDFQSAKELMRHALSAGIEREEIGIKYLDEEIPCYYEQEINSTGYLIPIGFPVIDRRYPRGIRRTDLICILGGGKGKKSWTCNHFGQLALMSGHKVLHITHELSAEDTIMRYDMMLGGLTSDKEIRKAPIENIDDNGVIISSEDIDIHSVWELSRVRGIRKKCKRFGGELIIKKYPMGLCTMEEIRRYLDYLETYEGFTPDVVINDYIEVMKLPANEHKRDAINDYYIQSKGMADEKKLAMITVSQTNRAGLRKLILSQKDFAEDIRKLMNADLVLAESQTEEQEEINRMQMWVLANRHGEQGFGCTFATNLTIGQLVMKDWVFKFKRKKDEDEETEK